MYRKYQHTYLHYDETEPVRELLYTSTMGSTNCSGFAYKAVV